MDLESLGWDGGAWTPKQTAMLADDGEGALAKGQLSELAAGLWGPSQGWQSGWVGRGSE